MAKKLPRFSAKEKRDLVDQIKQANSTIARLIESFLTVIDMTDDEPSRKEVLKTNFLFAVANVMYPGERASLGLAEAMEAVASDLKADGNPVAANIEALALAIRMRLKRR